MSKLEMGRRGEAVALQVLKANGYRMVDRNVRAKIGEIDVVARDGTTLCFVEIRTKTSSQFGWPEESVRFPKQMRLTRLAQWYLKAHRLGDVPVRFDVVSILIGSDGTPARTRLIKAAFDAVSG